MNCQATGSFACPGSFKIPMKRHVLSPVDTEVGCSALPKDSREPHIFPHMNFQPTGSTARPGLVKHPRNLHVQPSKRELYVNSTLESDQRLQKEEDWRQDLRVIVHTFKRPGWDLNEQPWLNDGLFSGPRKTSLPEICAPKTPRVQPPADSQVVGSSGQPELAKDPRLLHALPLTSAQASGSSARPELVKDPRRLQVQPSKRELYVTSTLESDQLLQKEEDWKQDLRVIVHTFKRPGWNLNEQPWLNDGLFSGPRKTSSPESSALDKNLSSSTSSPLYQPAPITNSRKRRHEKDQKTPQTAILQKSHIEKPQKIRRVEECAPKVTPPSENHQRRSGKPIIKSITIIRKSQHKSYKQNNIKMEPLPSVSLPPPLLSPIRSPKRVCTSVHFKTTLKAPVENNSSNCSDSNKINSTQSLVVKIPFDRTVGTSKYKKSNLYSSSDPLSLPVSKPLSSYEKPSPPLTLQEFFVNFNPEID